MTDNIPQQCDSPKHLRVREDTAPPAGILYIGKCGATGTSSRDFTKELDKVTCWFCLCDLEKTRKKRL